MEQVTTKILAIGERSASGWKMTEVAWWNARAAIVAVVLDGLRAGGGVVLTPAIVAYARALLAGEVRAERPARPAVTTGEVKAWWVARRAVADLLVPCLVELDGTVIPADVAAHAREILTGARRPPVLRNARTLRVTRAPAYVAPTTQAQPGDAPF